MCILKMENKGTEMQTKIRNRILIFIMVGYLVIISGLNVYQLLRYGFYRSIDISGEPIAGEEYYSWNLDTMAEKNGVYQIKGWIIRKQEDIKSRNIQLIVLNEDGTAYVAPTLMVRRIDVSDSQNSEGESYDYDYSGFEVSLNRSFVHSEKSKLYILYGNNGRSEIVDIGKTFELD